MSCHSMNGLPKDVRCDLRTIVLVLCLFSLLLVSCGMQGNPGVLENSQWNLLLFGPSGSESPVLEGSAVTLSFSDGKIGGSGGCNTYGGDYKEDADRISFSGINSTLMACVDEQMMQQEQQYFQSLNNVGKFEVNEDHLYLYDTDGELLLTFRSG